LKIIRMTIVVLVLSLGVVNSAAQSPQSSPTPALPSAECMQEKATITRLEARLRDWAAVGRYRADNRQTTAPAKNEKRVVFMGDSITDGWDDPQYGGFFPGKPYVNRGIGGQTTPQMLIRFRPDVIALRPEVVVILAGTNDIAGNTGPMTLEEIEGNLASMVELARAHRIRVVLASVMPVSDYEKAADGQPRIQTVRRPPEKIKALNDWIKNYAALNKLTYLDYYSATVDDKGFFKDELSNDGLHPNEKGYQVMAPLAQEAIERALKG
jgi:lysophospholipase L1-like esterase